MVILNGKTCEDLKGGAPLGFCFVFNSESGYVRKEYNFNKMCTTTCLNVYFSILCLRPIDRNSVVHSWDPSAVNGPDARMNKIFYFEQLSVS